MSITCKTLTLKGRVIELVAETDEKLVCAYQVKNFADNPVYFSSATEAITSVAGQLDDAGKFINAEEALNSITTKIEEIIPSLSILKDSSAIAFMHIIEIHPIDQTSFIISIELKSASVIGCVTIDGVGFQIKVTKTS